MSEQTSTPPAPKVVAKTPDGGQIEVPVLTEDHIMERVRYESTLQIAGLRGEMRTWFIVAIVGNQLLSHVSLAPVVGYVTGGAVIAATIGAKILGTMKFF